MILSVNTIAVEGFSKFFKKLGRRSEKADKRLTIKKMQNHLQALEIVAKIGTAAVCKKPKSDFSTIPGDVNFHHTTN